MSADRFSLLREIGGYEPGVSHSKAVSRLKRLCKGRSQTVSWAGAGWG